MTITIIIDMKEIKITVMKISDEIENKIINNIFNNKSLNSYKSFISLIWKTLIVQIIKIIIDITKQHMIIILTNK